MRLEFTVLKKEQVDLEIQLKLNKKDAVCHPEWLARKKRADESSLILFGKCGLGDFILETKISSSFLS
jgi:hypothetical protein